MRNVEASIRLEREHPLAIRWMHWVNFPVLFAMTWSGILVCWSDSDDAYQHPHRVYRIGLGRPTLFRFFPAIPTRSQMFIGTKLGYDWYGDL